MIPLRRRALLRATVSILTVGLLASACGGEPETDPGGPADEVIYLTGFGTFGREAPAYVADENGYFADENIKVDIQPGYGAQNLTEIAEGEAQFGLIDLSAVAVRLGAGEDGVIAISALQQQTTAALMTNHPDVVSPRDLPGKTVLLATGSVLELLFPQYGELAGFDADEVNWRSDAFPNLIPALAEGNADVIEQFVMGQGTVQAQAGGTIIVLPYSDVFRDLYGVGLFVDEGLAAENPDLCRRFNTALLRGLDYAVENPEEAGQILADRVPETNSEAAAQELVRMRPYVRSNDIAAPTGAVDRQRVSKSLGSLEVAGLIDPDTVTAEDLVAFELTPGWDEE